jgi:uncharacterized membrane protein
LLETVARSHFSGAVSRSGSTTNNNNSPDPRKIRFAVASSCSTVEQWMKPSSCSDGVTSDPAAWASAQACAVVMCSTSMLSARRAS